MKKAFDAVRIMREIRDHMSEEMRGMSPQDQINYIRQKAAFGRKEKEKEAA